jgi:hypothetical protein
MSRPTPCVMAVRSVPHSYSPAPTSEVISDGVF